MDDLLKFVIDYGGVVALLVVIVIVLWTQLTKHSVPKEAYDLLLKRFDDLDDDITKGILPALQKLSQSEHHTQRTLSDLRRNQEVQAQLIDRLLPHGPRTDPEKEALRLLKTLDDDALKRLIRELGKRRSQ